MILNIAKYTPRTALALRNMLLATVLRGGYILASMLLIPATLDYIDEYEYGIWLTLYSVLVWSYQLDLGLGSGLRNRMAESLAADRTDEARAYLSTALVSMTVVSAAVYAVICIVLPGIDCYSLFGVDPQLTSGLPEIIMITTGIFCISFIVRIAASVFNALQLPAINDLLAFLSAVISLAGIMIMRNTMPGTLKGVAILLSTVPAAVYAIALPVTFIINPKLRPRLSDVSMRRLRSLVNISLKFLLSQISFLIVYLTSSLIVAHLFGPSDVTVFNIVLKYFYVISVGLNIILTPLWTASTDAYVHGDFLWMRNSVRKLIMLLGAITVTVALMILLAPQFYHLWIGDEVQIPQSLTFWGGVYVVLSSAGSIFCNVVSGCGKVTLLSISSLLQSVLFIPAAVALSHVAGLNGIMIAMCTAALLPVIWAPEQTRRILRRTARGIWNK